MRRSTVPAIVLMALVATTAAAQGDPRLARLDPGTRAEVARLIDSLQNVGIPAEPLIDRALEGDAKGANGLRIATAVRAWGNDLATARGALGGTTQEATLVAGASALRGGVSSAALGQIAAARPNRDLLVPLAVLSELTASGVPVDTAVSAVLNVARRGGTDEDFRGLQRGLGLGRSIAGPSAPPTGDRGQGAGGQTSGPPAGVPVGGRGRGRGRP